jgi:hypothetical protein
MVFIVVNTTATPIPHPFVLLQAALHEQLGLAIVCKASHDERVRVGLLEYYDDVEPGQHGQPSFSECVVPETSLLLSDMSRA